MPYLETYRGVVNQADCDHLGHMNVARYYGICADVGVILQNEIGLTPEDMRHGRRLALVVVRNESDFKAEIMVAEPVVMRSAILEIGGKSMLFHHQLFRADGVIAFDTTQRVVLFDLVNRRAVEIPPDVREKVEAILVSGKTA
jgi:acyl-CoA thioester hydrolase